MKSLVFFLVYLAEEEKGFLQFVLQHLGFNLLQRLAVDADQTTTAFAVCNGGCGFLYRKKKKTKFVRKKG